MKQYVVSYRATIEGEAYVEAESPSEAKKIVRTALEPSYLNILDDQLSSTERYDFEVERYREDDGE